MFDNKLGHSEEMFNAYCVLEYILMDNVCKLTDPEREREREQCDLT